MPVSIAPLPHSLKSQRTGRKTYHLLVSEALDNSLDADALEVSVTIAHDRVEIVDDGKGLTEANITAPFTEGYHVRSSTTALGQFGVGITSQARKHGSSLFVDSVSMAGGRLILSADWDLVEKSGSWLLDDPMALPYVGPRRTIVKIGGLYKAPTGKEVERVREEIALRFYPAIADGRRIIVNRESIELLAEPELTNIVDDLIDMGDGRLALVHAGILKSPKDAKLYGVNISYRHRVIMPNSGFGCDGYSGIESMFARVELNDLWKLTSFKDSVDDADEMEDALGSVLEPILKKCHGHSLRIDIREALDDIYEQLGAIAARPIRKQTLDRKGDKKKRQGFVREPDGPGPAKANLLGGKLNIDFVPGGDFAETFGLGYVDRRSKKSHRVKLALDNDRIAYWMKASRKERAAALAEIAVMLWRQSDPQQDIEGFGKLVSLDLKFQAYAEAA